MCDLVFTVLISSNHFGMLPVDGQGPAIMGQLQGSPVCAEQLLLPGASVTSWRFALQAQPVHCHCFLGWHSHLIVTLGLLQQQCNAECCTGCSDGSCTVWLVVKSAITLQAIEPTFHLPHAAFHGTPCRGMGHIGAPLWCPLSWVAMN